MHKTWRNAPYCHVGHRQPKPHHLLAVLPSTSTLRGTSSSEDSWMEIAQSEILLNTIEVE